MSKALLDACGCFPTGRHYPGIAHLLRSVALRGLAQEYARESRWHGLPIALVDTETTGRDASVDRVIEVGIVVGRDGAVQTRHNWLINPGCPIPEGARLIHGIGDEDVKDAPLFGQVAHEIAAALNGCIPAAYNASFDRAFLSNEFARADFQPPSGALTPPAFRKDVEWIDPLVWARELQKDERSKTLREVTSRLGIPLENAHRASDDAEAALRVLYAFGKDARVPAEYGALVQEQKRLAQSQADERRRWKS